MGKDLTSNGIGKGWRIGIGFLGLVLVMNKGIGPAWRIGIGTGSAVSAVTMLQVPRYLSQSASQLVNTCYAIWAMPVPA